MWLFQIFIIFISNNIITSLYINKENGNYAPDKFVLEIPLCAHYTGTDYNLPTIIHERLQISWPQVLNKQTYQRARAQNVENYMVGENNKEIPEKNLANINTIKLEDDTIKQGKFELLNRLDNASVNLSKNDNLNSPTESEDIVKSIHDISEGASILPNIESIYVLREPSNVEYNAIKSEELLRDSDKGKEENDIKPSGTEHKSVNNKIVIIDTTTEKGNTFEAGNINTFKPDTTIMHLEMNDQRKYFSDTVAKAEPNESSKSTTELLLNNEENTSTTELLISETRLSESTEPLTTEENILNHDSRNAIMPNNFQESVGKDEEYTSMRTNLGTDMYNILGIEETNLNLLPKDELINEYITPENDISTQYLSEQNVTVHNIYEHSEVDVTTEELAKFFFTSNLSQLREDSTDFKTKSATQIDTLDTVQVKTQIMIDSPVTDSLISMLFTDQEEIVESFDYSTQSDKNIYSSATENDLNDSSEPFIKVELAPDNLDKLLEARLTTKEDVVEITTQNYEPYISLGAKELESSVLDKGVEHGDINEFKHLETIDQVVNMLQTPIANITIKQEPVNNSTSVNTIREQEGIIKDTADVDEVLLNVFNDTTENAEIKSQPTESATISTKHGYKRESFSDLMMQESNDIKSSLVMANNQNKDNKATLMRDTKMNPYNKNVFIKEQRNDFWVNYAKQAKPKHNRNEAAYVSQNNMVNMKSNDRNFKTSDSYTDLRIQESVQEVKSSVSNALTILADPLSEYTAKLASVNISLLTKPFIQDIPNLLFNILDSSNTESKRQNKSKRKSQKEIEQHSQSFTSIYERNEYPSSRAISVPNKFNENKDFKQYRNGGLNEMISEINNLFFHDRNQN